MKLALHYKSKFFKYKTFHKNKKAIRPKIMTYRSNKIKILFYMHLIVIVQKMTSKGNSFNYTFFITIE
uniref:Uncharacterized protein n=1 Tax=Physcomitrium patens TaxID=3218 RepID=A0A2K1L852_PHYPA|nr:hypothetical protein PHYPA_000637 [Physcomitrium patens]